MEMPKPSDGHRALEKLSGNWEGEETMHPSQWDPKGGTATGRNRNRIALGGFALINDYEQEREGVITFSGHGVMTYDREQDLYSFHWFDSMGSPLEVFTGRFEGDVLKMSHGGPMHELFTWDLSEPDTMVSSMDMSPDGSSWNRFLDATYRKV